MEEQERLLTPREAAGVLGVKTSMLVYWRQNGGGPRFIAYGPRTNRYRLADLIEFRDSKVKEG